ncbi:catabolite repressor/activator [Marinobacter caseinilyticus]|uniref:catabolite repressor/activator n=1 Tax=Marinobacter caseinilyticus TaxID=2692195 RepID=UPI00140AC221|nr:catabolite repressor/activator [Marinobacter caseinilyticus]
MTLAELARLAGVSRTTASYVLNGQARARRIKPDTIAQVLAVAEAHQFRIDTQAAALRGGASRTIGFILPDLENASYARLAKLLELGCRAQGYQLLIAGSDDDPDTEKALAQSLKARRCDALIVASCLPPDGDFYPDLMAQGLPVIAIDRAQDPQRIACVVSDNRAEAAMLTRSVLGPGVRRVAWMDAVPALTMTQERRSGFHDAIAQGPVQSLELSGEHYDRETGAALMRRLLQAKHCPEALVTASYTLLQGVLDVMLESGATLPEGFRIATFGDDRLLDFLPMTINSLPQQHQAIADLTLAKALAAVAGDYAPGLQVVERTLTRRQQRSGY